MWPCSRLVTTERDGYFAICPSLGRTLMRTKFINENNLYKPTPENLRGTTGIQLLVVQRGLRPQPNDDYERVFNHGFHR